MHSLGATWVLPATGTAPEFFDELGSFLMGPKNQKKNTWVVLMNSKGVYERSVAFTSYLCLPAPLPMASTWDKFFLVLEC